MTSIANGDWPFEIVPITKTGNGDQGSRNGTGNQGMERGMKWGMERGMEWMTKGGYRNGSPEITFESLLNTSFERSLF